MKKEPQAKEKTMNREYLSLSLPSTFMQLGGTHKITPEENLSELLVKTEDFIKVELPIKEKGQTLIDFGDIKKRRATNSKKEEEMSDGQRQHKNLKEAENGCRERRKEVPSGWYNMRKMQQ